VLGSLRTSIGLTFRRTVELRPASEDRASRKASILDAVEALFEPLAQLLVSHGVSSPEAESLLRAVCVHEAAKTVATDQKKTNVSRVALVTGVDRADVARILRAPPRVDPGLETRRHVNRVLAGWHSDRDFADGDGHPLLLQIKAREHKLPTFWTLVSRYAPGIYPGLLLNELIRVRAVQKRSDGRVQVRMRRYRTRALSDESLREVGYRVRDLMRTMVKKATDPSWPHSCRTVETIDIDPRFLPLIRKMFADRIDALLSGIQEGLRSSRWRRTSAAGRRARIGLTVFSHEEEWAQRKSKEDTRREYSSPETSSKTQRAKSTRASHSKRQ